MAVLARFMSTHKRWQTQGRHRLPLKGKKSQAGWRLWRPIICEDTRVPGQFAFGEALSLHQQRPARPPRRHEGQAGRLTMPASCSSRSNPVWNWGLVVKFIVRVLSVAVCWCWQLRLNEKCESWPQGHKLRRFTSFVYCATGNTQSVMPESRQAITKKYTCSLIRNI